MRIVLDTNVFISGVFFSGPPYLILTAWRDRRVQIVLSVEILEEYQLVGERLGKQFPGVELSPILELLIARGRFCLSPELTEPVCDDPEDDKFLACAAASRTRTIVSGDKALLRVSGYRGIEVIRPRQFVDVHL